MAKFEYAQDIMDNLSGGALLTTKENGKVNTMTISWGNIGIMWGKQIFMAMVRDTRFTKSAMDNTLEFTVSIPTDASMKSELGICGSKSGKDIDKIQECNLELINSETISTPSVKCSGIIIECRTLFHQRMDSSLINEQVNEKWYSDNNLHTLYYGEITNIKKI